MVSTGWVTVTSLVGVVIGGMLSVITQRLTERSATHRFEATILEGRRRERLTHLINFIETAQEAERLAVSRHRHRPKRAEWAERTDAILDQLWVKLRAVQLLCPSEVSKAAHTLAWDLHRVLREGPGNQSVAEFLHSSRTKLIDLASRDLDRV